MWLPAPRNIQMPGGCVYEHSIISGVVYRKRLYEYS